VVVAAMGQEPRLGRWARDAGARNGVLIHRWGVDDEGESTDDDEE
jgi:ribosomal RNA-processing protein 9